MASCSGHIHLILVIFWCSTSGNLASDDNQNIYKQTRTSVHKKVKSVRLRPKLRKSDSVKGLVNGTRKNLGPLFQECQGPNCVPIPHLDPVIRDCEGPNCLPIPDLGHVVPYRVPIHIEHLKDYPVPVPTRVDTTNNVLHVHIHDGNPCKNGGIISEDHGGTYHCTCPPQFGGNICDVRQYCYSEPCQNGGSCIEELKGYKCQCPKGFSGEGCEDENFCTPNPCEHAGTCVEKLHGYKCACHDGYVGRHCKDIDPCFPNPCQNGGECEYVNGTAKCHCHPEYHGDFCHEHYICLTNPCHNGGKCVENALVPCQCPRGYVGKYCEEHVCNSNPCLHGGICKVVENPIGGHYRRWSYQCNCLVPYRGKKCQTPHPCMHLSCLNGGTCVDAYTSRADHEEHSAFDLTLPIAALYFICNCLPGFTGQRCEHDICSMCDPHADCIDYRCVCQENYIGDGYNCKLKKGLCQPNPCANHGTCTEGAQGGYDCHCPPGYCGPDCKEICDPCQLKPCFHGGQCIPKGQERICICVPPYIEPDCNVTKPSLCEPNPCKNGGKCVFLPDKNDFICKDCTGQFTGKDCSECNCPKAQPIPGRVVVDAICDAVGECRCPSNLGEVSFTEKGCVLGRTDPCASKPCKHGTCVANPDGGTFTCIDCPPPYYGTLCECTTCSCNNPCQNGATCLDTGTKQFKCTCSPGYTGSECAEKISTIITEPRCYKDLCQHGGTCIELPHAYDCICTPQYTGPHCGVDKCEHCDVNAICVYGRCRCRKGYIGTGYVCEKKSKGTGCGGCPPHYYCYESTCICQPGNTCKVG